MSPEDQQYEHTIINLEISGLETFRALSIYFDFRANGYTPEQAYEGVGFYMQTGETPKSKAQVLSIDQAFAKLNMIEDLYRKHFGPIPPVTDR